MTTGLPEFRIGFDVTIQPEAWTHPDLAGLTSDDRWALRTALVHYATTVIDAQLEDAIPDVVRKPRGLARTIRNRRNIPRLAA